MLGMEQTRDQEMARRDGKEEHQEKSRGQCLGCTCGAGCPSKAAKLIKSAGGKAERSGVGCLSTQHCGAWSKKPENSGTS